MINVEAPLSESSYEPATLVDVLRRQALHQPGRRAFTFLVDGESDEVHLTYGELDRQARAIGAQLQRQIAPGARALLLYPPGLEYIAGFLGCLYAGVIAVPAYPPNPARLNRTLPRLQTMVANAGATVVLTTSQILSMAPLLFEQAPDLGAMEWLATDAITGGAEQGWQQPDVAGDTLAFLQYTSGSTGTPKGVMLSHANLLHNSVLISQAFSISSNDSVVIWLPPYHDMGLIGGILQPLYRGIPCVLMSPVSFLQRPLRWLQAISRYGGTVSGGPNFAYDLCARRATPEQVAALDLSKWELAFSGAEPVRPETLERFAATFAPCGFRREAFYPCYGLAEGTLIVSGGARVVAPPLLSVQAAGLERGLVVAAEAGDVGARTLVSCGTTLDDQTIAIVDTETMARCPADRIGEIWVSGGSVAQGYWGRPEESRQTFDAHLADTGEGPFLRTGDFGFTSGGELFVAGRLKDLIIIDGRNHYPQDIELTVEQSHPALRSGCSAAFAIDAGDQERLVVVAEVERNFQTARRQRNEAASTHEDAKAVAAAIRQAVAEQHDVRVHAVSLLKTGYIPKTSSGKIQRHACRAGFLAGTLEVLEG
jgi:acyl-CoA synthetase (AMP-forming)/AMP-acid ligase II